MKNNSRKRKKCVLCKNILFSTDIFNIVFSNNVNNLEVLLKEGYKYLAKEHIELVKEYGANDLLK